MVQFHEKALRLCGGKKNYAGADALAVIGAACTTAFGLFEMAMGMPSVYTVVIFRLYGTKEEEQMKREVSDSIWNSIFISIHSGHDGRERCGNSFGSDIVAVDTVGERVNHIGWILGLLASAGIFYQKKWMKF